MIRGKKWIIFLERDSPPLLLKASVGFIGGVVDGAKLNWLLRTMAQDAKI